MRAFYRLRCREAVRLASVCGIALACCCAAFSRPVILEEVAQITEPDPAREFTNEFSIDGNDLFVCGRSSLGDQGDGQEVLLRFERQVDGRWLYQGVLVSDFADHPWTCKLAVKNGVGAFVTGRYNLHLLERTSAGWSATKVSSGDVQDVAVQGQTIAIGSTRGGISVVRLFEKNASGTWVNNITLDGPVGFSDDDFLGPYLEFAPNSITAGHWSDDYSGEGGAYVTYAFDRLASGWSRTDVLERVIENSLVLDGQIAFEFAGDRVAGQLPLFFTRNSSGVWNVPHRLETDEWYADKRPGPFASQGAGDQTFVLMGSPFDDVRGTDSGSLNVFSKSNQMYPPFFTHTATLIGSDARAGTRLGRELAVHGRRVVAKGTGAPDPQGRARSKFYVFDLPPTMPTPSRIQDTFEDVNAAGWTPWGTSDWRVVASSGSYVFRQSDVQGDARAIFDNFTGENQSIQADLRVNAFADPTKSCWAGLMVRYTDSRNFYYLMNGRDTLQIRKIVNGVYGPIATTPFTMQVGRNYRFRLEAIGTRLRAYVDDKLMLDVHDTALASGRTGLAMWKADAQFDNVLVSTNPTATLHADSFSRTPDEQATAPWVLAPANAWTQTTSSGATIMRQSSTTGDARAIHGAYTDDQVITADIRPTSFHPDGGFVGLMARYQADTHYYYVLLTKMGKASLRRNWARTITVLEEVQMPVTLGTSYKVRFEAIGNQLRLYVNGRLMAEAQDDEFPRGRYGMVTYRGAADFDNFRVTRP